MICFFMIVLLFFCVESGLARPMHARQSNAQYIQEAEFVLLPSVGGVNLVPYRADQDIIPAFTVADAEGCHWIRYQNARWQGYDRLPPSQAGFAMTACRFVTLPASQRTFLWVSYFTSDSAGNNMVEVHEVIVGVIQRQLYQAPFSLSGARGITSVSVSTQDNGLYVGVLGQSAQPWYYWDSSSGSNGGFVYDNAEQLSNVQDFRTGSFPNATSPTYWMLFACTGATCPVRAWDGTDFSRLTTSLPGSLNSASGCAWGAQATQPCTWVSMTTGDARLYCLESGVFIFRGSFSGPATQSVLCVEPDSATQRETGLSNKLVWQMTTGFTVQYSCNPALPLSCSYSTNTLSGGVELEVLSSFRIALVLAASGGQQRLQVWIDDLFLPPIYGTLQLIAPSQAPSGIDSETTSVTIVGSDYFTVQTLTWGAVSSSTLESGTYTLFSQLSNDHGFCVTQYYFPNGDNAPDTVIIYVDLVTSLRVEYTCPAGSNNDTNTGEETDLSWLGWLIFMMLAVGVTARYLYSNKEIIRKTHNVEWAKSLTLKQWFLAWILNKTPAGVTLINDAAGYQNDGHTADISKRRCIVCSGVGAIEGSDCCAECACVQIRGRLIGGNQRCKSAAALGYLYCREHNTCKERFCQTAITVPGTHACEQHLDKYCDRNRESAKTVAKQGQPLIAKGLVCNEFFTVTRAAPTGNKEERRCAMHGQVATQGVSRSTRCQYTSDECRACLNPILSEDGQYCPLHLKLCEKQGCKIRTKVNEDRCAQHTNQCITAECINSKQPRGEYCQKCYQSLAGDDESKRKLATPLIQRHCNEGYQTIGYTVCGSEELRPLSKYCGWHIGCKVPRCENKRLPLGYEYCEEHACPYVDKDFGRCRKHKRVGSGKSLENGCKQHAQGCAYCFEHHDECPQCHERCGVGSAEKGMCPVCESKGTKE